MHSLIKVFYRFYQLFKLFSAVYPSKQDCSYSSQYLIYDQSLYTSYLYNFSLLLSFNLAGPHHLLNFLVAYCPTLISKNVCTCETGISKVCHKHKTFHFYSIQYNINLICTKFVTFTVICTIVPKGWCCPLYYVYLMPV